MDREQTLLNRPVENPDVNMLPEQAEVGAQFLPLWVRRAGCLALGVMAGIAGNAALPSGPDVAHATYAEPIPPLVTHTRKKERQDAGVVIANVPYGYFIGLAPSNNKVKLTYVTKAGDDAFGAIALNRDGQPITQCGWLDTEGLSTQTQPLQGSAPCDDQRKVLTNRYSFGHGFNCGVGVCDGGTAATHLLPDCDDKLYGNDAFLEAGIAGGTIPRSHTGTGLYNYIGKINNSETVSYRYTTNDGKAAVVYTNDYGWAFIAKEDCIAGYPQGGPPNTENPN